MNATTNTSESPTIVINPSWFAPFEGESPEVRLEIRVAVETYSLTGEVMPMESALVKIAFQYIKREIDAIKKRSVDKTLHARARQREAAMETNRKKAEKKLRSTTLSTVDRKDRADVVKSRVESMSDSDAPPRSDAHIDIDIDIDNNNNSTLHYAHRAREGMAVEDVVEEFIRGNAIMAESFQATIGVADPNRFRELMKKVLIGWEASGWKHEPITPGTHEFSAKKLLSWLRNEARDPQSNPNKTPDSNEDSKHSDHVRRHVASGDFAERQKDIMAYVVNNAGRD